MGLVDAQNKVNFYDGLIRVVDPTGKEYARFPLSVTGILSRSTSSRGAM